LPFALMATVEGEPRPPLWHHPPLVVGIQARPLTRPGVRVWLRNLLQREAPDDLVTGLLESTGGRPGVIRRVVQILAGRGLFEQGAAGSVPENALETARGQAEAEVKTPGPNHNLPIEADFLGREAELRALKTRLDAARLVVLVGPGGIGKTRLAVQAAAERIERFRDGVYLIPAGEPHSPDDLVLALAQPMRLLFTGVESLRTQLLDHLRPRRVLFVLDNLVVSADEGQLLQEILASCPEVDLLVTSRDRLNLPGEVTLELQGMELPPDDPVVGVESYPAVQLFLQCARRAKPGFEMTATERDAVVGICRLVEGMPLGIELAATWVRVLSCQEILAEIEMNLGFLAEAGPGRPRSLRAVFDHFWRVLSGEEQRVLRQLSIFRDGFRGGSAADVAGASLFFLSALVDKAFLRRDLRGRFAMHEVLRQYAQERLSEAPTELALARERHAAYYLELVERRDADLAGGRQLEALSELEEEGENLRAAWRWASASGRVELIDRSLDGVFRLHDMRNTFEEGCEALASAANLGAELAAPADAQAQARVRARLLVRLGKLRHRLSQHNAARQHLTEAVEVLRGTGPVEDVVLGECYLGDIAMVEGRYADARRHLDSALALALEARDEAGQARALNLLGIVSFSSGDLDGARVAIDRSLTLARRLEDRWGTALCLINLGIIADMRKGHGEARACYEESLALCRLIGDRRGMANCLNNLGFIAEALGEFDQARRLYEDGMDLYEQIGYRWGAANTRVNIANVTAALGDPGEAERQLAIALRAALDLKAIPLVVEALVGVAQLWADVDRLVMAQAVLGVALRRTEADVETRLRAERLAAELAERMPQQLGDRTWAELPLDEAVGAVVEALRPAIVLPLFARAIPP
jgi:predicted ATPase